MICRFISIFNKNPEYGPLFKLVEAVSAPIVKEHAEIQKKYKVGKTGTLVSLDSVAVHKDFGRRGIGGNLTKLVVQNSKKQGFWIAFSECTSAFSTKAFEKAGGKTEKVIDFKTFEIPGGCCSKPSYPLEQAT